MFKNLLNQASTSRLSSTSSKAPKDKFSIENLKSADARYSRMHRNALHCTPNCLDSAAHLLLLLSACRLYSCITIISGISTLSW